MQYAPYEDTATQDGPMPKDVVEVMKAMTKKDAKTNGKHWLKNVSPGYWSDTRKWLYIEDHYRGEVADEDKIEGYLIKRKFAESDDDYTERKLNANYVDHFSLVIDTLAGMVQKEPVERVWYDENGRGLGDPNDRKSDAWKVKNSVDGRGTNYMPFLYDLLNGMIKYTRVYVLVNGATDEIPYPTAMVIDPWSITNRRYYGGDLVEAVMHHRVDVRTSLKDDVEGNIRDRYTHFTLDGFTTYELYEKDGILYEKVVESVEYEYWVDENRIKRRLPLIEVDLKLKRNVAYSAAKKANNIFNKQSWRDSSLMKMTIPKFVVVADDEQFSAFIGALSKGYSVLQDFPENMRGHYFMTPPSEGATLTNEVLTTDVEMFYQTTFKDFNDAVPNRDRTATEVQTEFSQGVESFLTLASDALQEAETQILHLLEQAFYPSDPRSWGIAKVNRKKQFEPLNLGQLVNQLAMSVFRDKPLPIGKTGLANAAKTVLDYWGVEYSENEVVSAAEQQDVERSQVGALFALNGLPENG